jgi:membrane carboxypeptidase/penicillin-binding protein
VHPAEAYLVTSALEGVITRGTGRGLADLGAWGGLAGKSGTSNDWRDAWFVAYTSTLVVGAWVGYDDGRSLGVPGARAALPLVARFLRDALAAEPPEPFLTPEGIEVGWTGAGEFGWAGWDCGEQEVFLEGTAPGNDCRSLRWVEPWARATLDDGAEELLELLREYGDDFVRRLAQRLMERSRRGSR